MSRFLTLAAQAQEASATAVLAPKTTLVGEAVELRIEVQGASDTGRVPRVAVDGLEVAHLGTFSHSSMVVEFGRQAENVKSVVHRYAVTPQRVGNFTIPPVTIEAGGRKLTTEAVALRVQDGRGAAGRQARQAWVEVIPLKKSAYVGEVLPVEVRLHFHPDIKNVRTERAPTLGGEGFTTSGQVKLHEESSTEGGEKHLVRVFSLSITLGKAGPVFLGPAEVIYVAQAPADLGAFGSNALTRTFRLVERRAASETVELDVKPLPAEGRPAGFSGAVGTFDLEAEGRPARVKAGDPITMQVKVTGAGNFERIGAPALRDPTGWRAYPPASKFQPDAETPAGGTKTFEIAVIPEARKDTMPVFEFSYFDPATGKYETKLSAASPLMMEGMPPPAAATPAPTESTRSLLEKKTAVAQSVPEMTGIRHDFGAARSFVPLYERRTFWLAQLFALSGFFGVWAWRFSRRRHEDGAKAQAALRRERARIAGGLRRETERGRFYEAAARVLQIDTALCTGLRAETIDAATVRSARQSAGAAEAGVQEIFEARAEVLYAGRGMGTEGVPEAERERVMRVLGI